MGGQNRWRNVRRSSAEFCNLFLVEKEDVEKRRLRLACSFIWNRRMTNMSGESGEVVEWCWIDRDEKDETKWERLVNR